MTLGQGLETHIIMIEIIFSIHERNFEVICYQLYQLPLSAKAIPLDQTPRFQWRLCFISLSGSTPAIEGGGGGKSSASPL